MNIKEELAKELLSIIRETKDGISSGIQMASEQAPGLVREIMAFGLWSNWITIALCSMVVVLAVVLIWVGSIEDNDVLIGLGAVFTFGSAIALVVGTDALIKIVQINVAPKLYLIEYLAKFVGGG